MSVDRRLFISDRWKVEDVKETLENLFDLKIACTQTHYPDYTILNFSIPSLEGKEDEGRSMHVHTNSEEAGFRGTSLYLGAWGRSAEIFEKLAARLGGFYQESDCTETWVAYAWVAGGNLEFLLKEAIKTGKTDGRDVDSFIEYLKAHQREKVSHG